MNHEEFLKQVKERDAAFKVYGTDDCSRCDTGRITLFVKREVCEQCNGFSPVPTTYGHSDVPKLLAIIEKLKEQQKHLAKFVADPIGGNWGGLMQEFYKELDEIVGQP